MQKSVSRGSDFSCTKCGKKGHTADRCYKKNEPTTTGIVQEVTSLPPPPMQDQFPNFQGFLGSINNASATYHVATTTEDPVMGQANSDLEIELGTVDPQLI